MADHTPLSEAETAWFDSPVSVQVEPDNQRWLDTLLEMKPDELKNYAIFQYQIPKSAVETGSRDDVMQLIVLANKAGGGGSVVRARYRYLPGLKGILPPAITSRRGRLLYLTRGNENSLQVYSSETKEFIALSVLTPNARPLNSEEQRRSDLKNEDAGGFANEFSPAGQKSIKARQDAEGHEPITDIGTPTLAEQAAAAASPATMDRTPPTQPTQPIPPATFGAIIASLPRMTRPDLEQVATEFGATDVSLEKFPNNGSLREYVTNAIKAQADSEDQSDDSPDGETNAQEEGGETEKPDEPVKD